MAEGGGPARVAGGVGAPSDAKEEGTMAGIIAKINYCHARMSCVSLLLAGGHNLKGSDLLTISFLVREARWAHGSVGRSDLQSDGGTVTGRNATRAHKVFANEVLEVRILTYCLHNIAALLFRRLCLRMGELTCAVCYCM